MTWTYILSILAIIIIVAMAGYSIYIFRELHKQKRRFAQARQARIARLHESITIIAKAMQSGECNHSEGVIRLKMLLEPLGQKEIDAYHSMHRLYQTVKDMPTHDSRRALKRNERMKLDLARETAEAELEEKIKSELEQLLADIASYQKIKQ
ncbi:MULTISPECIES: DUF2489 domain-containing protein [Basfia]|uniref:DUF2489 domain-containing protein n=2 Tax=Basfia TaxID=697331 RepID=Q65W24_MANSM|nr:MULTISPECIES: DUF2489 domain-containing protein [Basfia]AAU36836.1 unknown [[Mannheimia] succiniciproducens MBEL55E]QIM69629.1 hypothetical protein A4G13_09610 [Basfia succiniciproducens]SCX83100.1 Protein of unknown function [Basfia succiniciproducens]SEQ09555.1 Protein of unknown function [Basfia succiniciproducens]